MKTALHRFKRRLSQVVVLASCVLLLGFTAFAYEYEVDGVATISPAASSPFSSSLQIHVKDGNWAIFEESEGASNRSVGVICDDGKNIYKLTRIETNNGTPFAPDDYSRVLPNSWAGEIHPSGFPYKILATEPVALFYAYASSGYLDTLTNHLAGSIVFQPTEFNLRDEQSPVEMQRGDLPLRLPTSIRFLDRNTKRTMAIFGASNVTNVGGMRLPLDVSVIRFRSDSTNVLTTYAFHVTRIAEKCQMDSFVPFFPHTAFISDYRFYGPPIVELATNTWPTLLQSKANSGYGTALIQREGMGRN